MFSKKIILFISLIILESHALNCRSEGSLKSDELKKIYNNCLNQHDNRNSSNSKRISSGFDWRDQEERTYSGNDWSDSDNNRMGNRKNKKDRDGERNWMNGRVDRMEYDQSDHDQMDRRKSMNDGRNQYNEYDRHDGNGGMSERDQGIRNRNRNNNGKSYQNDHSDERSGYYPNDDYGGHESQTQSMYPNSNRRYKRERSKNSGQRSQYNPNTQRSSDNHNDNRNSSDNRESGKACAMHCFLENLQMTGDNGMPDRYYVTNVLTKDVKNEDLRDFLQESIEECFQILDNENTEDKCEFSKNLLFCLSEKGRSNCNDWRDDIQFT
ncbi:unnamed protein product [Colias eurytheme]|nr:unnamed protein product [Colias eurytheme]